MSKPKKDKTVYVLGAGFSAGADLPVQSKILGNILSKIGYSFSGILATESEKEFQKLLDGKIEEVNRFVGRCFPGQDQSLEDIFTLLDQTIQTNSQFKGYSSLDLQQIRKTWIELLVGYFHALSAGYLQSENTVCQRFVSALLKQKIDKGQEQDPCSIISLNWDSIIEDSLYEVIERTATHGKADIDYCVYTTPLEHSTHTPSTKQKAGGLFNLKLLKIHGSTTWLRCPNSNHIYTGLGSPENPYDIYVRPSRSPFIEKNYPDSDDQSGAPFLEPFIITPTYSKIFDQPHIQTTWHNAYVELREAAKIVFVGYSLPEADYHFRTLLRRAIREETKIEVFLHENDAPTEIEFDEPEFENENLQPIKLEPSMTCLRYIQLFGKSRIESSVRFDGMAALIDELLPEAKYAATLEYISNKLAQHKTYSDFILASN